MAKARLLIVDDEEIAAKSRHSSATKVCIDFFKSTMKYILS